MVFPTRVGMNRISPSRRHPRRVFPTRVGMNRLAACFLLSSKVFPRAWG